MEPGSRHAVKPQYVLDSRYTSRVTDDRVAYQGDLTHAHNGYRLQGRAIFCPVFDERHAVCRGRCYTILYYTCEWRAEELHVWNQEAIVSWLAML